MSDKTKKLGGMVTHFVESSTHKRPLSSLNGKPGPFDELPWYAMSTEEKRKYLTKHNPKLSKEEIEEILKHN